MKKNLFLLLLAFTVFTAAGQEASPFRQRVTDVVVRTSDGALGIEAHDFVTSRVSTKKDDFVSQKDLAEDQRLLLDSGTFADVKILLEKVGDGVRVIYDVKVAPRIQNPIVVKGNKAFSARKVRKNLDLEPGDRIDRARLDIACDKLRDAYRKSYYNKVKVEASISATDEKGFAVVTVTVTEGPKEKLANFEFEGNKAISSSALRSVLGRPSPWNPLKIFYSQWRIDAFDRSLVRDRIAEAYREEGYLDVVVGKPELQQPSPDKAPILHISIEEGQRYKISAASINGVSLFPEREIRSLVSSTLQVGTPASGSAIKAAEKAVRDYYGSRGYVETRVSVKTIPLQEVAADESGIPSTLQINVKEGFLAHIRSVSIRGNTYTKDKVIRRELAIAPGMLMNEVLAERSRKRIENLGYFENVRFTEVPSPHDPTLRDVVFDVTEKSTGTLMAGVGTSNVDDFLAYIDISQNNFDLFNWPTFRGGGQKIRLTTSIGSDSNSGEISWTDPWFLDRQQSFNVTLFRREYGYSEYDETRIGGEITLAVPLKYGRLSAKLGAELVSNDDFLDGIYHLEDDPDGEFSFKDIEDEYFRVPFRVSWSYDTRNHPFVPSRGSRNNVFFEIQNSGLGSDYDLYKLGADLRQYIPAFFNHYLSLRLRAESVDTYGDTDEVPINDRYFLGGSRTIRGYRHREVAPKALPNEENGGRAHPVGGQTLGMFSAEYNIPLAKIFRIAAFYDVGNVWSDAFDFDFGELASTWGFGIRFDIPGFPIRLDYAMPLERDDDYTRTERFVFSIGFE